MSVVIHVCLSVLVDAVCVCLGCAYVNGVSAVHRPGRELSDGAA